MTSDLPVDLVGLLNEKYALLTSRRDTLWQEAGRVPVSASEWYLLSWILNGANTVSALARDAHISRQAAHKTISMLQQKGMVLVSYADKRRTKQLEATPFGTECYSLNLELRRTVEQEVLQTVGKSRLESLKDILSQNW